MTVVFASAARADLAGIGDYIRQDSPTRAEAFTRQLVDACEAIAELPFGAPVIPRYAGRGYRRKVYRGYLIIYRVRAEGIEIVRVIQGARDLLRLLSRPAL